MTTLNQRLRTRLLRHAVLRTRQENACVRDLARVWARMVNAVEGEVVQVGGLFPPREPGQGGLIPPDRLGPLLARLRGVLLDHLEKAQACVAQDLPALVQQELAVVPDLMQQEADRASTEALAEAGDFDPAKHPRQPKGSERGGEFAPKGGGGEGFKRVSGPEASEVGYAYHATNEERALEIATSGLKPHGPSYGTDQSVWPDGSREKRTYFTPTAENTWQFAPDEGVPVLLRVKQAAVKLTPESTTDLFTRGRIPAQAIEYLATDGTWHSLKKTSEHREARSEAVLTEQQPPDLGLSALFFSPPPLGQIEALYASPLGGAFYEQAFGDLAAGVYRSVRNVLTNGLLQGLGVDSVARTLRGVLGNKQWEAERIVRSEFVRAGNEAALRTYQANERLLRGVQWSSTLDHRTCLQCIGLDGRVWDDPAEALVPVKSTHPG